ncbi:MAG: hypothetical protein E6767_05910 [Dysgonomonas sp.]|nr:hypothetical protein [Dysgonomonas sp.]
MKKTALVLGILLMSVFSYAQNKDVLKDIQKIRFYGVDFSKAKVYGAKETPSQFKIAFEEINNLFLSEPKKFNVEKYMNKTNMGVEVDGVKDRIKQINLDDIQTTSEQYELSNADLQSIVKAIPTKDETTGVIYIAELLNKPKNRGYYHIVFFNPQTKEIIDTWKADGKAQGFGVRNFWAGSIYKMMKDFKLNK